MAKNQIHEQCKWLIYKFLGKIESSLYAREIKLAKTLLKANPETELWETLTIKGKLPSLAYFLTENGKEAVRKHFAQKNLVLPEKLSYDLGEQIKVKTIKSENKPKNIFNFLNS